MKNRKKSLINPDLIEGIWSVSDYYGSHGNGFVVQHNTCYGGHGQIGGLSEPCYICSKIKNQDSYYIIYTSNNYILDINHLQEDKIPHSVVTVSKEDILNTIIKMIKENKDDDSDSPLDDELCTKIKGYISKL